MKQILIWGAVVTGLMMVVFMVLFPIKARAVPYEECIRPRPQGKMPPRMTMKSPDECPCCKRGPERFRKPFGPDDNNGFMPPPPHYYQKRMPPRMMGAPDEYPCQKNGHKKFQRPCGMDDNKNFMSSVPDSRREKMHGCIMRKSDECHLQEDRRGRLKKSSGHCPEDNCPMESQNRNNCEGCHHQEERQEQPFRHSEITFPEKRQNEKNPSLGRIPK